jgi:hypothetical protein
MRWRQRRKIIAGDTDLGTQFFAKSKGPAITGGNPGLEARAIGQSAYGVRSAAAGAQKDIGAAKGINKAGAFKPLKRSAAYPKGPKL